ncbi:MAG: hypothetical protein E7035_01580 [Verrucomicrobiaceae bacterium]|nr:hypothetical protein [Verrucomicrobiaceae bacterium]
MNEKQSLNVVNLNKVIEVEAVPGKTIVPPTSVVPAVGIFKFIPQGGGDYKAVIKQCGDLIRLTPRTPAEYGLGIEYRSLKRLIIAGFVKGQKIAPATWQFSLSSYFEHIERTRNDPEFWDVNNPQQNYQKYQSAL